MGDADVTKILDYWNIVEMLTQDDVTADLADIKDGIKNQKDALKNGGKYAKRNLTGFFYHNDKPIYDSVKGLAKECGMTMWGNITVYVGKVRREQLIQSLLDRISPNEKGKLPEKDTDYLACASLQITANGKYIQDTFSLSPVIWADSVVRKTNTIDAGILSVLEYEKKVKEIEEVLLEKDILIKDESENGEQDSQGKGFLPFSGNALTAKRIREIYKYIHSEYLKYYPKEDIKDDFLFKFRMYADETERQNDEEEEDYIGLSRNFFSKDISMVEDYLEKNEDTVKSRYLTEYIESIQYDMDDYRKELINTSYSYDYHGMMEGICDIANAPLGKWPSKYRPALMQQIAVNLFIEKEEKTVTAGNMFSVNGPPGTGKTTLLKEVVANNVVERAKLLSEYAVPDEAFEERYLIDRAKYKEYADFYPSAYYIFKNERINDFGIVVTSCNNPAVENVTKEFPVKLLGEIKDEIKEFIYENQITQEAEEGDIYFTSEAKNLYGEKGWGLVAAALGKQSNIKFFYEKAVSKIYFRSMTNESSTSSRLTEYLKARKQFKEQYDVVKEYSDRLRKLCQAARERTEAEEILSYEKENLENCLREVTPRIEETEERLKDAADNRMLISRTIERDMETEKEQQAVLKKQMVSISEKERLLGKRDGELALLSFITAVLSFLKFLFRKSYLKMQNLFESRQKERDELEEEYSKNKSTARRTEETISEIRTEITRLGEESRKLDKQIHLLETELHKLEKKRATQEKSYNKAESSLSIKVKEYEQVYYKLREKNEAGDYLPVQLDDVYLKNALSSAQDISKDAHTANPWFTDRYDREREKLFLLALKVNKLFILSSYRFAQNLDLLNKYWGLSKNKDGTRLKFSDHDKHSMVPALSSHYCCSVLSYLLLLHLSEGCSRTLPHPTHLGLSS